MKTLKNGNGKYKKMSIQKYKNTEPKNMVEGNMENEIQQ